MNVAFDAYKADLIRYVLRRGPMARTKLMKLLFLIDRELHRRFGATVFRWKMYKYGPFSREVLDVLDDMEVYGSVVAKVTDDAIIYELASTAPAELLPEVKKVADQALETWTRRSLDDLLTHVYNLEEVNEAWLGKPLLGMVRAAIAVGLGALAEEVYLTQRVNELIHLYRRLQELRRRILQEVEEKAGEDVAEIASNIATAIRRYAPEIEEALAELRRLGADPVKASLESVVEEYAEVLRLDIPVGGGKTLEDLLYESRDEVLDKLHEIMLALYTEYVEIDETCDRGCPPETAQKLEKLATLELATCIIYKLFHRQKIDKKTAVAALNEIVDEIFSG
ncbi:MAG: hypothetical protein ACO2PN_04675 [Pyrobaculum sp.]